MVTQILGSAYMNRLRPGQGLPYYRVESMEESSTKGERREKKRRDRRKMRVTGTSVRLLLEIARRRAEKAKAGTRKQE